MKAAAARRQHMRRLLGDEARDHPPLAVAEGRLAEVGEDLRHVCGRPARSISLSASRKGSCSAAASPRPTVLLPAPISPTSTRVRSRRRGCGTAAGIGGSETEAGGERGHGDTSA